jgi:hypothetical protein
MEWRVFQNITKDAFTEQYETQVGEKRTDVYFVLPDPSLGLKIRDEDSPLPYIELKVRSARDKSGVERWGKVIRKKLSTPIHNDNDTIKTETLTEIADILSKSNEHPVRLCHALLVKAIETENVVFARVKKTRSLQSIGSFMSSVDHEVAFVEIKLLENDNVHYYESICLEGGSKLVEKAKEVVQKYNDVPKAGYPEHLISLVAEKEPNLYQKLDALFSK